MVSTSKILTVSYGTFSCTLEGFDDSFETMKAIAEYFRDLAADDRYFGAEPPTPDAEMLARIAEREISRRVEARTERGSIVLRPSPAALDSVAEAPAPADGQAKSVVQASETPTAAVAEVTPPAPVATAAAAVSDDDLASKLQRIRAAVAGNTAVASEYMEDEHAEDADAHDSATLDAVLAETPAAVDADEEDFDAEDDADTDVLSAFLSAETMAVEDETPQVEFEPERSAHHDTAEEDADVLIAAYAEEQDEDEATAHDAHQSEDAAIDAAAMAEDEDEDVAGLLDRLAGLSPNTDEMRDDLEALAEDADAYEAHDETSAAPLQEHAEESPAFAADETPQPIRARVVKIKRAELEAAIARGQLEMADEDEDAFDDDEADQAQAWDDSEDGDDWAEDDGDLSPEEEAELRRELAEVEAELSEDEAEDDPVESIFAEQPDDQPVTHMRRSARDALDTASTDRDMTRLMAKTISEMDEPESSSRRSAIAHLRAAVAATRADKAAGAPRREDTISDAFRADLAQVVRPRRPRAELGSGATARPSEPSRPAPLKLVAEQRIDAPIAPAAPVRPRRISVAEAPEAVTEDTPMTPELAERFADYVEETGAQSLPEILEAAASYLAFVEGRDEFSRPLLMTRARAAIGDDFNREDSLRGFGQLLRQGKIQKLKGGRFKVSDEIGFQPDERRFG